MADPIIVVKQGGGQARRYMIIEVVDHNGTSWEHEVEIDGTGELKMKFRGKTYKPERNEFRMELTTKD